MEFWSLRTGVALFLLWIASFVSTNVNGPTVSLIPKNLVGNGRSTLHFMCRVQGLNKAVITWYKNGAPNTDHRTQTFTIADGVSLLRMRTNSVRGVPHRVENYSCRADSGVQTLWDNGSLTVYPVRGVKPIGFPVFTKTPMYVVKNAGQDVTYSCQASGTPSPTITWMKDRLPIDVASNPRISFPNPGELRLSNLVYPDDNNVMFECVATNDKGMMLYAPYLYLQVKVVSVKPYFTITPNDQTVDPETDVSLQCMAFGHPLPKMYWKRENSANYLYGDGKGILTWQNVKKSANFSCFAVNDLGKIVTSAYVTVRGIPLTPKKPTLFKTSPDSITISWFQPGGGSPVATYTLKHRRKGKTWLEKTGIHGTTLLTLNNLDPFTKYEFCVYAVNSVGSSKISEVAEFQTEEKAPGSPPRDIIAYGTSSKSFEAKWSPPLLSNGMIQGYYLRYSSNLKVPFDKWRYRAEASNKTSVGGLLPKTTYYYKIQAFNSKGVGPHSTLFAVKTVKGVPGQPREVKVNVISSTALRVTWLIPAYAGAGIFAYDIYYNKTSSLDSNEEARGTLTKEIQGLNPHTYYGIAVAAMSDKGVGPMSFVITVRTLEDVPSGAPTGVNNTKREPTCLEIQWNPPHVQHRNGEIKHYTLKYREKGQRPTFITIDGSKRTFMLHNLKKFTDYNVWVSASTKVGEGPYSERKTFRTAEDVPSEAPRNVTARAINSTAIEVTWSPPSLLNQAGQIRGYVVTHQAVDAQGNALTRHRRPSITLTNSASEMTQILLGLQAETYYKIYVAAYTIKGDGPSSSTVQCKTLPKPPNKPYMYIQSSPGRPTEVRVTWATTESEVKAFKVRYAKSLIRLPRGRDQALLKMDEVSFKVDVLHHTFTGLGNGLWYLFKVSVRNNGGWSSEMSKWTQIPPGPPTGVPMNVTVTAKSSTALRVMWNKPDQWLRNGPLGGYTVQYNLVGDKSNTLMKNITNPNETRVTLRDLKYYTEYEIRVRTFGPYGVGPYSATVTERTDENVPSPPREITAEALSTTVIKISWKLPAHPNGVVLEYKILYTDDSSLPLNQWKSKRAHQFSTNIESLSRDTMYWISMAARTSAGFGKYTFQPITERTLRHNLPGIPRDANAEYVGSDTAVLKWSPPEVDAGITGYKVSYEGTKTYVKNNKIETETAGDVATVTVSQITLKNLMPNAKYIVRICAINSKGSGTELSFVLTTEVGKPPVLTLPEMKSGESNQFISVIFHPASTINGPISFYVVCVVPLGTSSELPKGKVPDDYLKNVRRRRETGLGKAEAPYIAAMFKTNELPSSFLVGDKTYMDPYGYSNKELTEGHFYTLFLRAYVENDKNSKELLYTSSPFLEPVKIGAGEVTGRQSDPSEADAGGISMTLIIAAVVAVLVIIIVVAIVVFVWRRKHHGEYKKRDEDKSEPSDPVEMKRMAIQTPAMMDHPPIHVPVLPMRVEQLKASCNAKFTQEYGSIEPGQGYTTDTAEAPVNKYKNRYPNILAYDHSRVKLELVPGEEGSDYVNANYCDGYRKENAYIATQGPLDVTTDGFWRMVWEKGTFTIVMLTKLEERGRPKCVQYWPEEGTEVYGDIEVTPIEWVDLAHYSIMTLQICKEGASQPREVKHFQFTGWPDHGVPPHPTPFLTYLRRVRFFNPPDAGPIVVHCSAGVGRTACFIVIDSMLERIKHENTVDIYGHVTVLRTQRNYMVQQEEQYIFIHDALLEAVSCGHTEVHARNLLPYINQLSELKEEDVTGLDEEFRRLSSPKLVRELKQGAGGSTINKIKNRHANILPYETTRVHLSPLHGNGSDYINANFVDGYSQRCAFIATQSPLNETVNDFWRMVMEQSSSIIVMLTQLDENDKEMCYEYWPTDHSARHEHYIVDPVAEQEFVTFIIREFKVKDVQKNTVRNIKQFHFFGWPEHGVPKTGEGIIDLIGQVQKVYELQEDEAEGPITVHCSDGVGRTGVFCTLFTVLERMRAEGVVDIFQTVKLLRTQRPNMVQTQEQYMFCYKTALEYLGSFDHYAI